MQSFNELAQISKMNWIKVFTEAENALFPLKQLHKQIWNKDDR